ncbi:MAG: twin-arginine translocation signal domain-containing protein [Acidobacteriaceae bacterium]|nr:twin-arginine translocation signal domain-containing protein [Acidobacteriaceae bacterium]
MNSGTSRRSFLRSASAAVAAAPLPQGSFPAGETLGLPPGLSVPGPLSPQALPGLWDWDCSAGVCVPGLGILNARPGWLNNITSVFGYDQNVPLQSCFGDVFLKSALNNLNPFKPSLPDITTGGLTTLSAVK